MPEVAMTLMPDVSGRATLCAVLTEWRRLLDASVSVFPYCQSSVSTSSSAYKSCDDLRKCGALVIDTIPHQIWSGPPDGSLDFCNAQWLSYVGFTQDEAQGEGWQRILHPDDLERVLIAWGESVAKGTAYKQEERHRAADGQYRWFLSRGVPLRNSEGRIVGWYGTNTDIEDRKEAEDRLRLVIDTLPALAWSKLPDGSADFLNQRFREYTGLSVEEG
jgi:PAS domain S-box-containing protein